MAKYTDNCNLILPEQNENYDVGVANTNNREIDFQLGNKVNKIPGKDLSTNDFTNEYKSKIDNLQKIYKFKGNVDTYSDLNNISANNGDIYNVLDEAKNYAWNGTEWVQLGFVIDMSEFAYREEIPTKNSELENDSNFVNNESLEAVSVPTGGTKGQILEKKSNEDNDVGWVDNTGGVTGDTLPIGSVVEFASDTNIPENWLLCNGQEVSRTEYDLLFSVIGTTWGEGDGSTTFNVPTKEGLVTVGKTLADSDFNFLGKTGGEKTHTTTVDEIPKHKHRNSSYMVTSEASGYGSWKGDIKQGTGANIGYIASADTSEVGGGQPHNILQPYVTSNFIIKAKQSAGVVATVVDNLESDSEIDALSAKQGKVLKEKIEGTILFSNTTGTTETITLNDNVSNYSYIEIFYRGDNSLQSVKIDPSLGDTTTLATFQTGSNGNVYMKTRTITISGTSISTKDTTRYTAMDITDNGVFKDQANNIRILKVIGYK